MAGGGPGHLLYSLHQPGESIGEAPRGYHHPKGPHHRTVPAKNGHSHPGDAVGVLLDLHGKAHLAHLGEFFLERQGVGDGEPGKSLEVLQVGGLGLAVHKRQHGLAQSQGMKALAHLILQPGQLG